MNGTLLLQLAKSYTENSALNYVPERLALSPELAGRKIFEAPIFGFAAAGDALFESFKAPEIIGPHFLTPGEWLPGSASVVSFFLPFTKELIESNAADFAYPSLFWLHGRIEGQTFIASLESYLIAQLSGAGMESMWPSEDPRFKAVTDPLFTSNWSERHAAYAAGLGTFGLSKGIITEKGAAGRLGSIVTKGAFEPTERKYADVYQYCSNCGACARHCPPKAISLERGKDHAKCSAFLDEVLAEHKPRYGCGKCQVSAPCTYGPAKR